MIFRLARRTSFAAPVGLGAALFALAAVLAFVGSLASPAGVARAQEGTDTTDEESGETESTTATVEICVEDPDSGEVTCSDETAPAGESQPMPEGGVTGQACERDSDETEYVCTEEIVITKLTTSTLKAGDSTVFTVIGRYLEWSDSTYKLKVKRESGNRDIGFDDDCEAVSASATAPKPSIERRYAYSHKFTLYACDETGGTVTAELLEDGRAIKSTSQSVTVRLRNPPTRLSVGINSRDADRLDVTYSRSEPRHHYQFEIHRAASRGGKYSRTGARLNSSSSPVSFDGLAKGYWYKARGRNCGTSDRDFCGDWSAWSSAIHLKLAPPTPSSVSVSSSSDDRVVVGYTRSESPHYYRFEILRSTSRNGSYTSVKTANDIRSPVYFSSLTKGYWYKARGKNCRTSARAGCGDWSGFSAPVLLPVSVSVSANTSAVTEGGRIKFTVTANPAPQFDITVKVKVSEVGSFITGTKPTSATIRSGSESAAFTVRTLDDSSDESNGSVTARLRNPEAGAGYKLGSPKTKTVRVRDNDDRPPPPANRAPTIGGSRSFRYQENGAGDVTTFTATDPDGDSIEWSLSGTDSGDFTISTTGGVLTFRNSPDFENPKDSDTNNEYQITVTAADDEGGSDSVAVAVTVTDVLEPPAGLSLSVNSTDDDKMDVAYTASEPPHYYQFEVYRASSKSGDYSEPSGVEYTANGGGTPPASFDGLTQGYWYKAQGKSCKTASRSACGAWSGFTSSVFLFPTLTPSLTPGDGNLTVSWTTPRDTDKNLAGYKVKYRKNTSATTPSPRKPSWNSPSSTLITNTSVEITDLTNGVEYEAQVSACNDSGGSQCGPWTASVTGTPRTTPDRIDKNKITLTGAQNKLTVVWNAPADGGAAISKYQIIHKKKSTDAAWPPNPTVVVTPTPGMALKTEADIVGLDDSTSYKVQVRACNTAGCKDWPTSDVVIAAYAATGYTALAVPTDLDVVPMPLRMADLTWTGDADTTQHEIEVRKTGGDWSLHTGTVRSEPIGNAVTYRLEIALDAITQDAQRYIGLANHDEYEFRVKSTDSGKYPDSEISETVRIIESPIVRVNGDSRNAPAGEGWAKITWTRMADVAGGRYTVRARKLFPEDHHRIEWSMSSAYDTNRPAIGCVSEPAPCLSLPDRAVTDRNPRGRVGERLSYTRNKLELGKIYGIQLSYKTVVNQNTVHVFSANDMYVWPSTSFPGGRETSENRKIPDRVATYPFFGYHADRDYAYRVCKDTFFPDVPQRQNDWVNLIEHAFEQWEIATDGFVTVTPEYSNSATRTYETCTDMSYMRMLIHSIDPIMEEDDVLSEIRMVDFNTFEALIASVEIMSDPFKVCILSGSACVTSRTDYDDDNRGADNPLSGVDVTFKRSSFEDVQDTYKDSTGKEMVITTNDGKNRMYPRIPSEIGFNTCLVDQYSHDPQPDLGYLAYSTAVHEAGHALGLSNVADTWRYAVNLLPFDPQTREVYTASHSSTPDSVMNYDDNIFENYDHTLSVPRKRHEPDCSPHPFDVLAIYSLYQTRNP